MTSDEEKLHPSILSALSCTYHVDLIPNEASVDWIKENADFAATTLTSSSDGLEEVASQLKRLLEGKSPRLLAQAEGATFSWLDDPEYEEAMLHVLRIMHDAAQYRIAWNRKQSARGSS